MGSVTRYKTKKVTNVISNKLNITLEDGKELNGWYWLDDVKRFKVFVPHQHGGGKGDSISKHVYKDIKNNLKVTEEEFDNLYECPMSGTDYANKIRKMIANGLV
jgi:hypothetical protein